MTLEREGAVRRSRLGRLALGVSIAFLVLTIRLPAGSAFLEIINQSRWIREFILRDDLTRIRSTPAGAARPESRWIAGRPGPLQRGLRGLERGAVRQGPGRLPAARRRAGDDPDDDHDLVGAAIRRPGPEQHGLAAGDLPRPGAAGPRRRRQARPTCPSSSSRTTATPGIRWAWPTSGWGTGRRRSALYRSMELRNEGDSFDWFFLAMIHAHLGRKERAREWYDKASQCDACPVGPTTPSSTDSRPRPPRRWACPSPIGPSRGPRRPPGRRSICASLRPRGHFVPDDQGSTRR